MKFHSFQSETFSDLSFQMTVKCVIFDTLRYCDTSKNLQKFFYNYTHIPTGPQYFIFHTSELHAIITLNQDCKYPNCISFFIIMPYKPHTERDSILGIRVLTIRSLRTYSPRSTNKIYEMHTTLTITTPVTHTSNTKTSAEIYDTPTNARSYLYTVTLHLNFKNSYTV
jgi:hypothetical protein